MDHVIHYLNSLTYNEVTVKLPAKFPGNSYIPHDANQMAQRKLAAIIELAEKQRHNYAAVGNWGHEMDEGTRHLVQIESWARENFKELFNNKEKGE